MTAEVSYGLRGFQTGGKQYRVQPGDTLDVELIPNEVDSLAEFAEVLAVSRDGELTVGSPTVPERRFALR